MLARVDELGAVGSTGEGMELAERAAAEWATRPEVRRRCSVVVPVAGLLAAAAANLTDAEYQALRQLNEGACADLATVPAAPTGRCEGPSGPAVADQAGAHGRRRSEARAGAAGPVRPGRCPAGHRPDPVRPGPDDRRSGRRADPAQRACRGCVEQIESRLGQRAEGLKARSALSALEALVRTEPPPAGSDGLRYRFDRIRSGTHELTELDLVDALRSGELRLMPTTSAESAERLLGAAGPDPRTRLALAPDAGSQEIAMVAGEQLAHWQALAAHPVSGKDLRDVAADRRADLRAVAGRSRRPLNRRAR